MCGDQDCHSHSWREGRRSGERCAVCSGVSARVTAILRNSVIPVPVRRTENQSNFVVVKSIFFPILAEK
jgi:hypothetical protein